MDLMPIPGRFELTRVGAGNRSSTNDRTFRRAVEHGRKVRVRRGVFLAAPLWEELTPIERHRLTAVAASDSVAGLVLSHSTAASLWGVPLIGTPVDVETLTTPRNGSRREGGLRRWASPDLDLEVVEVDGIRLTTLTRTVVDVASSVPFPAGAAAVDWALAQGVARETLSRLALTLHNGAAVKRAIMAIAFGDERSGSPGESVSRALIRELGFPDPELQVQFFDRRGLIGLGDFYWRRWALIGEFDGLVKYRDPAMLKGRTPAQALADEKRREDRLRRTGPRVARWVWEDLTHERLGALLLEAGLPRLG